MNYIIAILVFGLLIFVHELGHFFVAKLSGITVLQFTIGFGPAIFKKQIGETPICFLKTANRREAERWVLCAISSIDIFSL